MLSIVDDIWREIIELFVRTDFDMVIIRHVSRRHRGLIRKMFPRRWNIFLIKQRDFNNSLAMFKFGLNLGLTVNCNMLDHIASINEPTLLRLLIDLYPEKISTTMLNWIAFHGDLPTLKYVNSTQRLTLCICGRFIGIVASKNKVYPILRWILDVQLPYDYDVLKQVARDGPWDIFRDMFDRYQGEKNEDLLSSAVIGGNLEILESLMRCFPGTVNNYLWQAVRYGHLHVLEYLLELNVKPEEIKINYENLIYEALYSDRTDILEWLYDRFSKGGDGEQGNEEPTLDEDQVFQIIAERGCERSFIWLIKDGYYPQKPILWNGILGRNLTIIEWILNNTEDSWHPYYFDFCDIALSKFFMDKGYGVDSSFCDKVAIAGNLEMLKYGRTVHHCPITASTLSWAIMNNHVDIVKYLLQDRMCILDGHAVDDAVWYRRYELIHLLIEKGCPWKWNTAIWSKMLNDEVEIRTWLCMRRPGYDSDS